MRQDVFSILYLEDEEKDRKTMRALIESICKTGARFFSSGDVNPGNVSEN